MEKITQIQDILKNNNINFTGISLNPSKIYPEQFIISRSDNIIVRIDEIPLAEQDKAKNLVLNLDLSSSAQTTRDILNKRNEAANLLQDNSGQNKLLRAVFLYLMDEINTLRQSPKEILPPRTFNDIKTGILNKLNSGQAD